MWLFEPFGLTYSQVCGYVHGYLYHSVDAFDDYIMVYVHVAPMNH